MFDTVLVGIDEYGRGRDAIALAQRLVSPRGKLIFANVHPGYASLGKGDNGEFEAVERGLALGLLNAVIRDSGVRAEARCLGADRIGNGLHRLAESTGADLLVLGSSHEGQHGRVWLRDAVRRAINGAPCAVAVAPLAYADLGTPITQIGIAYNGSEESRVALAAGSALADDLHATATVFEALVPPLFDGQPEAAEVMIREFERTARERITDETGLGACTAAGDAVEELALFSGSVDLLIVSSRDFGPIGRLVHGSTTHGLLGYARSPLLILNRAARSRAAGPAGPRIPAVAA